ncbi:DUF2721 domain-containing protein [Plasticicumulans acidivorans]|uniref:Uncharacterized protein DUF2721 n=1 Tax=Plasticicumulans acidivorans TaxID=886464 RepID=A0A317MSE2_9GAMM|nr:DUF2721 domain-containing protein [Plasticicumulans acidivorans]PWV60133.1 uncharacterized protein DUF2721 [Plasticicumulans acidivorans]
MNASLIIGSALTPVVMMSGVALLILSMGTRFGRVMDRTRIIHDRIRNLGGDGASALERELSVLMQRCRLMRTAVLSACCSVLCVAITVATLFCEALFGFDAAPLSLSLFALASIALVVSVSFLIADVHASLKPMLIEIEARA